MMKSFLFYLFMGAAVCFLSGCTGENPSDDGYTLKKEDIRVVCPSGEFEVLVNQPLKVEVESVSDENVEYRWFLGEEEISKTKSLEYSFEKEGTYNLRLQVSQGDITFDFEFFVYVSYEELEVQNVITKVFDYCPAPGQFVNIMPKYEEGDTQETMNAKVLKELRKGMPVTLGGYGGYVVVGFDHTIENKPNVADFRILGNAFVADGDDGNNGNCEPGVIMIAYDKNKNGLPDDEWYEIAGSAHRRKVEDWYEEAKSAGNDITLYKDYEITYYRPETEDKAPLDKYIRWKANKGTIKEGYKRKYNFHLQPYYPQWKSDDKLVFKGTCLPQNGFDISGNDTYFVLHSFSYGYADNVMNSNEASKIDIDWAIDKNGKTVNLPGVDFIKIYTGVNQENGMLGECSTEISGVVDLHLMKE